jgi:propanol-preferring alcohol dehydrogenase
MLAQLITRIAPITPNSAPLELREVPIPEPGAGQLLLAVQACGVCHTELDEVEGRTPPDHLPRIPGHQVVGRLVRAGPGADRYQPGERLGVAWIFSACGACPACLRGDENLCPDFKATGRDADGGYAQFIVIPQDYAIPIPPSISNTAAAPLLCAGAVGYRALRLSGMSDGLSLGFSGFGASAHLVLQLARVLFPRSPFFVFSRSPQECTFALELGAQWAGSFEDTPPTLLDRIIDTTPAWQPVLSSLSRLAPGGRLVINAIRKEDADRPLLLGLDYASQLWQEKEIKSVANVTREDVRRFLELAASIPIQPEVQEYPLEAANTALLELKRRQIRGAKVLVLE